MEKKKPKPPSIRNKNAKRNRKNRIKAKRKKHTPRDGHTNETFKVVTVEPKEKHIADPAWAPYHRKRKAKVRKVKIKLPHISVLVEVPSGTPTKVHNAMRSSRYTNYITNVRMTKFICKVGINVRQTMIAERNGWRVYEAVSNSRGKTSPAPRFRKPRNNGSNPS